MKLYNTHIKNEKERKIRNNIKLARVDNRYIHGQVSARLVRELGITKILLISDACAADPLMSELYKLMAVDFGVDVLSIQDAADKWREGAFNSEPALLLLWGNIGDAVKSYQMGMKYAELALANIPGNGNNIRVNNSCYITGDEAGELKKLSADGVEVYFQATTDIPKVSLDEALKITKL